MDEIKCWQEDAHLGMATLLVRCRVQSKPPGPFRAELLMIFFFLIIIYFILLFLAVLGLRFCARAFSSCGKRAPLFIVVHRPLTIVASLVAEHKLQTRRLSSCGSRA